MTSPNIPRVIEFLGAHPKGVYGWQIAGHIDVTDDSAVQTLLLLQARSRAVMVQKGRSRAESLWKLASHEEGNTPPVFRAMQTLKAFQDVARAKLTQREVVCA
jgi:hypothetical protein